MNWYVVQTKPQEEDLVRQRLEKADFEVFLPRIKVAVRGFRGATRIRALFPAYLFTRCDFSDPGIVHMIKYTRGVRKILGGDTPVPLPDVVVDTIKKRVGEGDVVVQQMVFKKGDKVRIKSGWMEDLVGILERPVSPQGRVRVLLDIVDKCVRAELSSAEIEHAV
jgi:transcriptional antiterminator RfaH